MTIEMAERPTETVSPDLWTWLSEGLRWRLRDYGERIKRQLGTTETQWARVVMDRETERFVASLRPASLDVLEVSGAKWKTFGFATYRNAGYPEYDVCSGVLDGRYDLIIAEQVLEHVLWPYRAVRNMRRMLKQGGVLLITTPFLLKVHGCPIDCSRWTELGLKQLLAEGGFELQRIETGAWGNRACVVGNFRGWKRWNRWLHSLDNEPDYPVVVWAFARESEAMENP